MFSPTFPVLLLILPDYFLEIPNDFLIFTGNQKFLTPPGPAQKFFKIFCKNFCKNFCSAKIFEP